VVRTKIRRLQARKTERLKKEGPERARPFVEQRVVVDFEVGRVRVGVEHLVEGAGLLTDSTSFLLPCSTSLDANNHAARAWGARPAAGVQIDRLEPERARPFVEQRVVVDFEVGRVRVGVEPAVDVAEGSESG
jgi:hypothetical protein